VETLSAGTVVEALDLLAPQKAREDKRRLPVLSVSVMLEAQRQLTAVDRFSKLHDSPLEPRNAKYYRDLIPLERPKAGEQYAFEVDLDRCTGCKSCVTACHTQNGLDEGELWRSVGLLHGGSPDSPVQQTVTTACHHCVEPACLEGCPTQAYEKDPITGIVKHLDDQCFGCQYCTLMCPYDAPKYNASRGIVRKCDMCSDRLARDEAPACVQACPSGAIAIRVIDQTTIVQGSDARQFLPGAPGPEHTLPATRYQTRRPMPANLLPADFYMTRPEHSHPPLVIMLILTQLSAGAFGLAWFTERAFATQLGSSLTQALFASALALLALFASVFHLGRPRLAFRAVLGWRTSWLSREAIAFGLFAALAMGWGALGAAPFDVRFGDSLRLAPAVRSLATLAGTLGVFCSVMVYVVTRREHWSAVRTGIAFFGTTLVLGGTLVQAAACAARGAQADSALIPSLLWIVITSAGIKVALEVSGLRHVRERRTSAKKRMAQVMLGELGGATAARLCLLVVGGVLLPSVMITALLAARAACAVSIVTFCMLFAGELLERYLFFRAAPASSMPGGLR
jgi:Fe-S-cluster-containing dehydrogenase component/DMSO reductase anchor subunit